MRVLIAGATGDTGAYLTHKLAQTGHEPIAMVRESSDTSHPPAGLRDAHSRPHRPA